LKKALITGITGQDGSYLTELLLSKGYEVHGLIRRASTSNTTRIEHLQPDAENSNLILHFGDLATSDTLLDLIYNIRPDELYNLGAQSHVRISFDMPEFTGEVTGLGTLRLLDAIRKSGVNVRFYQASSSEMFGNAAPPQCETTPFQPQSPYAAAKVFAYWITRNYREAYHLFALNGILFNHESPRRGTEFVTRKITRALAAIKAGKQKSLVLGNLDARRDWGYAPEYVEVMWRLLNMEQAADYVCGTGETHSIEEFLTESFGYLNLDWHEYVKIDPRFYRPTEVNYLQSDPSRIYKALQWEPCIRFKELVRIMVDADLERIGLESPGEGKALIQKHFNTWHLWEHQAITMD
jgi:GDPmannose 4,6-dehydratase